MSTARNRAIDRIRRERTFAAKAQLLAAEPQEEPMAPTTFPDERLELIFMCCHPALSVESQVALTLRTLGGLTTDEIARAFVVPEPTMSQRLTRAKRKIAAAAIPFRVPPDHLLPDRLVAVLAVVYLVFNEGYSASPTRGDLADEAIRLGRALAELMPDESEVHGLLALMLLLDARLDARFDDGEIVLLADQDRPLGRHADRRGQGRARPSARDARPRTVCRAGGDRVAARRRVPRLGRDRRPVRRALPAHRLAGRRAEPSRRGRRDEGPDAGLAIVDGLSLDDYRYVHSTRAELLRRLGRTRRPRAALEKAREMTHDEAERRLLDRKLAELGSD